MIVNYDSKKDTVSIAPYKKTNTLPLTIGIFISSILALMLGVYFIAIREEIFWIILCFAVLILFSVLLWKMIKMCILERKSAHFKIECTPSAITFYDYDNQICSVDAKLICGISLEEGLTSSYSVGLGEWFGHIVNDYTVVVYVKTNKTSEKELNRATKSIYLEDAISFVEPLNDYSRKAFNKYSAICLFSSYSKKRCNLLLDNLKKIWAIDCSL